MCFVPWGSLRAVSLFLLLYEMIASLLHIKGKKACYQTTYFLLLLLFFGGICTWIGHQFQVRNWYFLMLLSLLSLLGAGELWKERIHPQRDGCYEVSFLLGEKKIQVSAFLDTGNRLYEPISHMPVSILDEGVIKDVFHMSFTKMIEKHRINRIRMIPYHSVGTKEGAMMGVLVHEVVIKKKNKVWKVKCGVIGISSMSLCEDAMYEMLLHPDFVHNQEGISC